MPQQRIEYGGTIHEFPDDFSDKDIQYALQEWDKGSEPPKPAAGFNDARSSTEVMQDQAANVMRGIPQAITGIPGAATSVVGAMGQALTGGGTSQMQDIVKGIAQPITTSMRGLGALIAPDSVQAPTADEFSQAAQGAGAQLGAEALGGAGDVLGQFDKVKALRERLSLPSTERAGQKFEQVMGAAKDVPVDLSQVDPIVERAKELRSHGHTPPSMSMRQYSKAQQPQEFGPFKIAPDPMTYETSRDFAVSAGDQSAQAITGTNRTMKRQNKSFAKALDDANREAAYKAGRGEMYDQAMAEYRNAKRIQKAKEILASEAAKKAISGIGTGLGIGGGAAIYRHYAE